mgnify:FL=1
MYKRQRVCLFARAFERLASQALDISLTRPAKDACLGLTSCPRSCSPGVAPGTPKHEIPLYKKILAGAGAGALSSAVANPTDLVKVRLQTDGQLKGPDGNYLPKKYTGMGHAFTSIVKEEGVLGLWKGVGPTCGRATALAAAELATYDEVKARFLHTGIFTEGLACTLATAFVSAPPPPRAALPCTAGHADISFDWCLSLMCEGGRMHGMAVVRCPRMVPRFTPPFMGFRRSEGLI